MRLISIFAIIIAIAGMLLYFTEDYEQGVIEDIAAIELIQKKITDEHRQRLAYYKNNPNIDSVDLSNCALHNIPFDILGKMPNLRYLNLSNNQLTSIGDDFSDLSNLEYLDISSNLISNISNRIIYKELKLKHLFAAHNRIDNIAIFFTFDSLEILDLSYNNFRHTINLQGYSLPNLKVLNLSDNEITHIETLSPLTKLKVFKAANNQLGNIPIIEKCDSLSYLDLSNNKIVSFSKDKQNPKSSPVRTLLLSANEIGLLEFTAQFENVEHLDLAHNKIQNFGELYYFEQLNYVNLSDNIFNRTLDYLDDNAKIDSLDLSNNKLLIIHWESDILTYLNLSDNNLSLDNCILETNQLTNLDISNNKKPIQNFYNFLKSLPNLKRLDIRETMPCKDDFKNDFGDVEIICEYVIE